MSASNVKELKEYVSIVIDDKIKRITERQKEHRRSYVESSFATLNAAPMKKGNPLFDLRVCLEDIRAASNQLRKISPEFSEKIDPRRDRFERSDSERTLRNLYEMSKEIRYLDCVKGAVLLFEDDMVAQFEKKFTNKYDGIKSRILELKRKFLEAMLFAGKDDLLKIVQEIRDYEIEIDFSEPEIPAKSKARKG